VGPPVGLLPLCGWVHLPGFFLHLELLPTMATTWQAPFLSQRQPASCHSAPQAPSPSKPTLPLTPGEQCCRCCRSKRRLSQAAIRHQLLHVAAAAPCWRRLQPAEPPIVAILQLRRQGPARATTPSCSTCRPPPPGVQSCLLAGILSPIRCFLSATHAAIPNSLC
jgi:hypothetical protein